MNKRKWGFNIILAVVMLTVTLLICGFDGKGVYCESEVMEYTFNISSSDGQVFENTEDTAFTIIIPCNKDVELVIEAEIDKYEENSFVGNVPDLWYIELINGSDLPEGITLGETTCNAGDTILVSAVLKISKQTEEKAMNQFSIRLRSDVTELTLTDESYAMNIVSKKTMECAYCGGLIQADGEYEHQTCEHCNAVCDGTSFEHGMCELCQGVCDGSQYIHEDCGLCGAVCDGIEWTHRECGNCHSTCNGDTFSHEVCSVCGGKCDGEDYVHKGCSICGSNCVSKDHVHVNESENETESESESKDLATDDSDKPGTSMKPENTQKPEDVATGDDSMSSMAIVIMLISAMVCAAMASVCWMKRK